MSGALAYTPIQVPDYNQTLARLQGMQANRLQMLAAQRQLQQGQAMDEFLANNAGGFAAADPSKRMNVLAQLAAQGQQGAQVALPMIQQLREQEQLDRAIAGLGLGGSGAPSPQAAPGAPSPGGVPSSPAGAGAGDPSLPRGLRNNNPLNLSFVQGQPGVQGTDGRFGIYATPEAGIAAGVRQLQLYAQRGVTRLGDIINRWAPPSENNTRGYVATVARLTGLGPNDPVDLSNPEVVTRLVTAMAQVENGRPLDPAIAARGVQLALGGGGGDPNAIPVSSGGGAGEPPVTTPSGVPVTPERARQIGQGLTSDQFMRFAASVANNPNGIRLAQLIAPFVRQGENTEIKELQPQGRPRGLYVVSRDGRILSFIGETPASPQGSQAERDRERRAALLAAAQERPLTPREQLDLETIERDMTMPQTIADAQGNVRTIQPPPLPGLRGAAPAAPVAPAAPAADPNAIPVQTGAPAAGGSDAVPLNQQRQQTTMAPGGQRVTTFQDPRPQPETAARGMLENVNNLRQAREALELIRSNPGAVGLLPGALNTLPVDVLNRTMPEGTQARAAIAAIGAQRVHDLSGAAVTLSEYPRLRPFIPQVGDDPETVQRKLTRFIAEYENILRDQYRSYGPENNFRAMPIVEEILAPPRPQTSGPGGRGVADPPLRGGDRRPPLSSFGR